MKQIPKYQYVLETLERAILSGSYQSGEKLPSEAALVRQFSTSRITVGRALRELQQRGLVERRAGSGTYVRPVGPSQRMRMFGLLIPELEETEIFEPICQGIARAPEPSQYAVLWGNMTADGLSKEEQAWRLCQQYIERGVLGVFFAPLEAGVAKDETNGRILQALEDAHIAIVLLDRCVVAFPQRGPFDLVGIDNRRAGYMVTEHLLKVGARRIGFVAQPHLASTVEARIAGYREALLNYGAPGEAALVRRVDPRGHQ